MQKSNQWRNKPSEFFPLYLEAAQNTRLLVLQENGPTKFIVEDSEKQKFKIEIGNHVKCSCGGGVSDHCIHIIYILLKIFRLEPNNPLIWQLSYKDAEVDKIISNRYTQAFGKTKAIEKRVKGKMAHRIRLTADSVCCICHDAMGMKDLLTFCKVGCGNNFHSECAIRWIKHQLSQSKKIACPLCRSEWDQKILVELKKQRAEHKKKLAKITEEAKRKFEELKTPQDILPKKYDSGMQIFAIQGKAMSMDLHRRPPRDVKVRRISNFRKTQFAPGPRVPPPLEIIGRHANL